MAHEIMDSELIERVVKLSTNVGLTLVVVRNPLSKLLEVWAKAEMRTPDARINPFLQIKGKDITLEITRNWLSYQMSATGFSKGTFETKLESVPMVTVEYSDTEWLRIAAQV